METQAILRGVHLLGVDSANTPMPLRQRTWNKLAMEWRPDRVHDQVQRQPVPVDFHRHRIDEEWHVIIVHRDAHCQTALSVGEAIQGDNRLSRLTAARQLQRKARRFLAGLGIKTLIFARQRTF